MRKLPEAISTLASLAVLVSVLGSACGDDGGEVHRVDSLGTSTIVTPTPYPSVTPVVVAIATTTPSPEPTLVSGAWVGDSGSSNPPDLTAGDRTPLPFPTPGAELRYEDPGWDLVEYAALLCLAEALSDEDEGIARTIGLLEDTGGAHPPEDLQGFHDGLVAKLRGISSFPSSTAQRMAEETFAQAKEHPLLAGVMNFPCEIHYETIGQAMQEVSDMMHYGMPLCFRLEDILWNEEDALERAVETLEAERWPEDLQELRDELVTALKVLPEDASREEVEAVLEAVQEYPALMLAMPCVHSAGSGGIEFWLGEAVEEALLDYCIDVCGAWNIALEGGSDGKYGAIAALEAASPPHGLQELHEELIGYLESLPDTFTENHAVEAFEIVGVYPLLKDAVHCELGEDVLIPP